MIKSQSPHPLPPPTLPPSPPPPPPPLKPSDTTYKTWMGHQQTTCVQLPQPGGSPAQQVWRWCLRHPQLCRLLRRSLWRRLVVTVKCAVLYTVCRGSSSQIPCFFWGGGGEVTVIRWCYCHFHADRISNTLVFGVGGMGWVRVTVVWWVVTVSLMLT